MHPSNNAVITERRLGPPDFFFARSIRKTTNMINMYIPRTINATLKSLLK